MRDEACVVRVEVRLEVLGPPGLWSAVGALLGAVLDDARAEGVKTVNLRVEKANEPALSLYRKCGFVVDDSHHVMSSGRTPSGHVVGRG